MNSKVYVDDLLGCPLSRKADNAAGTERGRNGALRTAGNALIVGSSELGAGSQTVEEFRSAIQSSQVDPGDIGLNVVVDVGIT